MIYACKLKMQHQLLKMLLDRTNNYKNNKNKHRTKFKMILDN